MSVTEADLERAAEVVDYYRRNYITPAAFEQVIAQALADERERALASSFGRHEPSTLAVTGPGTVTCDGGELRWTARVAYVLPASSRPDATTVHQPDRGRPEETITVRTNGVVELSAAAAATYSTERLEDYLRVYGYLPPGGMKGTRVG